MSKIDSTHPKGQNEDKLLNSLKSGDIETAKQLLELSDIDINCEDEDKNRPIIIAVELNYFDIVKILIEKGADLLCKNKNGDDILRIAIRYSTPDMLEILLEGLNKKTKAELDAEKFFEACKNGDLNLLKEMLNKSDIDINCKNDEYFGYTPLHIASEKGNEEIVKELLKYPNIKVNTRATTPVFNLLNVDYTPLHLAVKNKHVAITELLLKNGADVNARISLKSDEFFDYTPLIFACEDHKANEEIVKLLINYNADVNCQISQKARKIKGYTPLHLAVENNNYNILQLLIENGAKIDANAADYKQTPLMVASLLGCYDLVVALIKSGADKNMKDELGCTALDWAKNYKNESFNMQKEESFLKIIKFLSDEEDNSKNE